MDEIHPRASRNAYRSMNPGRSRPSPTDAVAPFTGSGEHAVEEQRPIVEDAAIRVLL